jgi:hypothetical protein
MSAQPDVRQQSTTSVTMAPPPALPALDLPPDETEVGVTENRWGEWEEVPAREVNRRVTDQRAQVLPPAELPVTVRLEVSGHEARDSVRDEWQGLPLQA